MKFDKSSFGLLILRFSIGILLLFHGISKLSNGIDWIKVILSAKGLPEFIAYGVFIGEVIAPILLILGFRTKIGAILIAINMIFAVSLVHLDKILTLNQGGGWAIELDALYFFGAITLLFTGGGKYTITRNKIWD